MRKKQSSSKLQRFTYIMLILASVVGVTCGVYFLYEKYQTYKLNEEIEKDKSAKVYSFCILNKVCIKNDYQIIGNTLYYNLTIINGLDYVKEKYKKYYKDKFAENNHNIKWKDYFDDEKKVSRKQFYEEVYVKQFDREKWLNVLDAVKKDGAKLFTINIYTKDGIEIGDFIISRDDVKQTTYGTSENRFINGMFMRGNLNLKEEIVENFNRIDMGWSISLTDNLESF